MPTDGTVYVVGGCQSSGRTIHTDRECDRLQSALGYTEREYEASIGGDLCGVCAGGWAPYAGGDNRATERRLDKMNPEDAGLSPMEGEP